MMSDNVGLNESSDDLDQSIDTNIQSIDQIIQSMDAFNQSIEKSNPSIESTNQMIETNHSTVGNQRTNDENPIRACTIMAESGTNNKNTRSILKKQNLTTTFSTFSFRKMSDLQPTATQAARDEINSGSGDESTLHSVTNNATSSSNTLFTSRNDREADLQSKMEQKASKKLEKDRKKYDRHQEKHLAKRQKHEIFMKAMETMVHAFDSMMQSSSSSSESDEEDDSKEEVQHSILKNSQSVRFANDPREKIDFATMKKLNKKASKAIGQSSLIEPMKMQHAFIPSNHAETRKINLKVEPFAEGNFVAWS